MPAQIKKEFKQLKIRFIEAHGLPRMDLLGTIDAYVSCTYLGKVLKTEAKTASKEGNVCIIDQEMWIPIQWPVSVDRLILKLMDEDILNDDIAGSMYFSLKKLMEKGSVDGGCYYWQNLYGAPPDETGHMSDMMNNNPEFASTWKGRILMHLEAFGENDEGFIKGTELKKSDLAKHPERKVQPL